MKKIEIPIEGSGLDLPPLVRDSEGYLRGGFIGIGGNGSIDLALNTECKNNCQNDGCDENTPPNIRCKNTSCINDECTNNDCYDESGTNKTCVNNGCLNNRCQTTTGTTNTASLSFSSLLI